MKNWTLIALIPLVGTGVILIGIALGHWYHHRRVVRGWAQEWCIRDYGPHSVVLKVTRDRLQSDGGELVCYVCS